MGGRQMPSSLEVAANVIAAFAILFVLAHVWIFTHFAPEGADFWIFWHDARHGLYSVGDRPNLSNPHTHHVLYGWAGWIPLHSAFRIAALGGFLAYLASAPALVRAVNGRVWAVLPVAFLITAWPHTWIAAHNGHMGGVLLVLLALAWVDLNAGRNGRAGIWMGAALAMKAFILLPVAALLLTARRRAAYFALLVTILIYGSGIVIWGIEVYSTHFQMLAAHDVDPEAGGNFSIYAAAIRTGPGWIPVAVTVPCLVTWAAWGDPQGETALGAAVAGSVLLSPLAWYYYQPLLVLPLLVCWRAGGWVKWSAAVGWWIGAIYEPEFPAVGGLVRLASVAAQRTEWARRDPV